MVIMMNKDKFVIDILVNNEEDMLSPFSGMNPIISSSLFDYLEQKTNNRKIKNGIVLNVISNTIDALEELLYKNAIYNTYEEKYLEAKKDSKRNLIVAITMMFIGILTLVVGIILDHHNKSSIILEIYDIIAWVFIWEAVDIFFFKQFSLKFKRKKYQHLMNAEINFKNKDEMDKK